MKTQKILEKRNQMKIYRRKEEIRKINIIETIGKMIKKATQQISWKKFNKGWISDKHSKQHFI